MKKVLIDAVLIGNLGDDLFVKVLLERYKNESFSIIVDNEYSSFLNEFNNVNVINNNKIRKLVDKVSRRLLRKRVIFNKYQRKSDATVLVSGSAFIQQENYEAQIQIYKNDIQIAKKYFLLGVNFGPYSQEKFKDNFKEVFAKCDDVCFREDFSYSLFSEVSSVRCAPDIVFTLDNKKYLEDYRDNNKKVGISVIDLSDRADLKEYKEQYEEKMTEIITAFINKGYEINMYSFCKQQNDEECVERIIEKINDDKKSMINKRYYRGDIDYILNNMKEDEYIIATRFHAMILGWKFGKKVYPLVYSNKMKNVIEDLGFKDRYSLIKNMDSLNIEKIIEDNCFLSHIEDLEKKADMQFKKLDEFISE